MTSPVSGKRLGGLCRAADRRHASSPITLSSLRLAADAASVGKNLHHRCNVCVGAGRANEGLRADWQEQLAFAVDHCDFQYVRCHGLFHDDMFVYKEVEDAAQHKLVTS